MNEGYWCAIMRPGVPLLQHTGAQHGKRATVVTVLLSSVLGSQCNNVRRDVARNDSVLQRVHTLLLIATVKNPLTRCFTSQGLLFAARQQ
jgi:hypothetical protein